MAKPACGARKPIKNQEGQGMLDIDENSSVEDDMFENVKTDEDMDHEMEEEEGGSAFEEEIDSDESDQQEQAVIPKSQTPFLSDKDTPESYGELIGLPSMTCMGSSFACLKILHSSMSRSRMQTVMLTRTALKITFGSLAVRSVRSLRSRSLIILPRSGSAARFPVHVVQSQRFCCRQI